MQSWREARVYDFSVRRPEVPGRHIGNVSVWHLSRSFGKGYEPP